MWSVTARPALLQANACAARALVEAALDASGWPWSRFLALRLDGLVLVEAGQR